MKDVHTEHCCKKHGCKYLNDNCTVANGTLAQSFPCEECHFEKSMLPNYIHLVWFATGDTSEYSVRVEYIVKAFVDKSEADAYAKQMNDELILHKFYKHDLSNTKISSTSIEIDRKKYIIMYPGAEFFVDDPVQLV